MTLEPGEADDLIEAAVARIERFPEMHRPTPEPLVGATVGAEDQAEAAERNVA